MKFESDGISSVFLMPSEIVKYLKKATASEIKVAVYIFSRGLMIENEAEIAEALGLSESKVSEAIAYLRGTGILSVCGEDVSTPEVKIVSGDKLSDRSVSYSSGELADAIEGNEDFASLVSFASERLGKILTPAEQSNLFMLVDMLDLPCDLIMAIIEYCTAGGKKSVKYIERTAERLFEEDGVDTYAKFEIYLHEKQKSDEYEAEVKRLIGAESRALTKSERAVIAGWARDSVPTELLAAAYERTIHNISKPSLSYMSKIVENWKSKGIKTLCDLEDQKPFESGKYKGEGYFELDDFTEKPDDDFEE